jgi:hypothetical protein
MTSVWTIGMAVRQARSKHLRSSSTGGGASRKDGGRIPRPSIRVARREQCHESFTERLGRRRRGSGEVYRCGNIWCRFHLWKQEDIPPSATQQEIGAGRKTGHENDLTVVGARGRRDGGEKWAGDWAWEASGRQNTGWGHRRLRHSRRSSRRRGDADNRGRELGNMDIMKGRLFHYGGQKSDGAGTRTGGLIRESFAPTFICKLCSREGEGERWWGTGARTAGRDEWNGAQRDGARLSLGDTSDSTGWRWGLAVRPGLRRR